MRESNQDKLPDHFHDIMKMVFPSLLQSAENERRLQLTYTPPECEGQQKIQTSPIFPPIHIRSLDWCATFDNYEPGQPIGHGATEQEAIEDLKAQVEK